MVTGNDSSGVRGMSDRVPEPALVAPEIMREIRAVLKNERSISAN